MATKREALIASAEKSLQKGKVDAALKDYLKVLEETPNDINILNKAGDLNVRLGRNDESITYFLRIAEYYARDGFLAGETRRRRQPVVGNGAGVFSFCHVEDAASATVAAVESPATGVLNVCDDEPAPMKEWLPVYAAAIGAKPPSHVPRFIARLLAGDSAAGMAPRIR